MPEIHWKSAPTLISRTTSLTRVESWAEPPVLKTGVVCWFCK